MSLHIPSGYFSFELRDQALGDDDVIEVADDMSSLKLVAFSFHTPGEWIVLIHRYMPAEETQHVLTQAVLVAITARIRLY